MRRFPPEVVPYLRHYVYLYVDPDTREVFYVGKGIGNRAFTHLDDGSESATAERIRQIRARGREPHIEILVHGLETEELAYRVETAAIDLVGRRSLTNRVRGWRSREDGRMSAEQLVALHAAEEVEIVDAVILVRINELFRYGMSPVELYDATRGVWKVSERRTRAELALAVFDGVVQEVYRIQGWSPAGSTLSTRGELAVPGRWEFVGSVAEARIRTRYLYKSVRHYLKQGTQNPITYVNASGG